MATQTGKNINGGRNAGEWGCWDMSGSKEDVGQG